MVFERVGKIFKGRIQVMKDNFNDVWDTVKGPEPMEIEGTVSRSPLLGGQLGRRVAKRRMTWRREAVGFEGGQIFK